MNVLYNEGILCGLLMWKCLGCLSGIWEKLLGILEQAGNELFFTFKNNRTKAPVIQKINV